MGFHRMSAAHGVWLGALALAALAVSAPMADAQQAAIAAARAKGCAEHLKKNYGAAGIGDVSSNRGGRTGSIYADMTLANGQSVRVRCRFEGGGVSEVQVYAPPALGSGTPGNKWASADPYRVPPKPETPAKPEDTAKKDEPAEKPEEQEATGPKRVKPPSGS